ncbi:enoyl-CoA hydratase/isomerase family protein [Halobacillus sp. B23F22_1]|uniref:enoyl-CoA hydratase/isomerase family protein n=1 Tax=Halobacillus sp. B23F22_1 TaxID=3459514 RepID=UPI00373FA860
MMKPYETINVIEEHKSDSIVVIELNRPEAMNSLNTKMSEELIDCLRTLKNRNDTRVLILTGSGEKSFCAGADLKERKGMSNQQWKEQHDCFEEAYDQLRNFPFPTIAMVNGFALGGGMEMVLSCDLRYISEDAKMGLPEVTLGIIPGVGGTQLLPRTISVNKAKEFLFRGNHISSQQALETGIANDVFNKEDLYAHTLEVAKEIARNAPLSLKALKKSVNLGTETDLTTALSIELDQYYTCANSKDRQEGIKAFNEKRNPLWQGE